MRWREMPWRLGAPQPRCLARGALPAPREEQACGGRGELARRDSPAAWRAGQARAVGASSRAGLAAPLV